VDVLDLLLIVVCLGFAASGYRQGFVIGVLSFVGFIGGGALGAHFAPQLHDTFRVGDTALFGLLVVFAAATLGQLAATAVGIALRRALTWRPARLADSVGGAAVSAVSVLLVAWLIGTAVAHSALGAVGSQVRHSAILTGIDDVMPDTARTWFSAFRRLLDRNGFPEVFGAISPERIVPVPPPNPRLAHSAVVRAARPDVVKIRGAAPSCQRQLEGSGFVYAPDRVMTNAHVVAGVTSPTVQTIDGRVHDATVVLYDPHRDVAVLDVPGLGVAPIPFAGAASRGDSAIVAGYPEDGPFLPVPARVRDVVEARGSDIYQSSLVTRQIYSLYAVVRPGNSGGPLLAAHLRNGRPAVYGVVFAAAVDDRHTGYALTAAEVASDARAGAARTTAVSTQGCD
jgi:S1-C subfamily serine protease